MGWAVCSTRLVIGNAIRTRLERRADNGCSEPGHSQPRSTSIIREKRRNERSCFHSPCMPRMYSAVTSCSTWYRHCPYPSLSAPSLSLPACLSIRAGGQRGQMEVDRRRGDSEEMDCLQQRRLPGPAIECARRTRIKPRHGNDRAAKDGDATTLGLLLPLPWQPASSSLSLQSKSNYTRPCLARQRHQSSQLKEGGRRGKTRRCCPW